MRPYLDRRMVVVGAQRTGRRQFSALTDAKLEPERLEPDHPHAGELEALAARSREGAFQMGSVAIVEPGEVVEIGLCEAELKATETEGFGELHLIHTRRFWSYALRLRAVLSGLHVVWAASACPIRCIGDGTEDGDGRPRCGAHPAV